MGTNGKMGGGRGKFIVIGGSLVVVVAALVIYMGGMWPPKGEDVAGTIGAAERYRAEQIKGDDVQLEGMDLQKFMQTELFHKMITDPEIRKALASPAFAHIVANEDLATALIANNTPERTLAPGRLPTWHADLAKASAASAEVLEQLRTKADWATLTSACADYAKLAETNPEFLLVISRDANILHELAIHANFASVLINADFRAAMTQSRDFAKEVASGDFGKAIQSFDLGDPTGFRYEPRDQPKPDQPKPK